MASLPLGLAFDAPYMAPSYCPWPPGEPVDPIDKLPDGWSAIGLVRALPLAPDSSVQGPGPKVLAPFRATRSRSVLPDGIASGGPASFTPHVVDPRELVGTQTGVRLEALICLLRRGNIEIYPCVPYAPLMTGDCPEPQPEPPPRIAWVDGPTGARELAIYDGHHRLAAAVWGGCRAARVWLWTGG